MRMAASAVLVVAALWATVSIYAEYEAHRAAQVLAEAGNLKIGDAENAVLPFIWRYGGHKWTTRTLAGLGRPEDWTSRWAYEHERRLLSDYEYVIEVSPWGFRTVSDGRSGHRTRFDEALGKAMNKLPASERHTIGMRDWFTGVEVSIRDGRVSRVSGIVLVEGRSRWLGHEWLLQSEMPREDLQSRTFVVDGAFLTMDNGGGSAMESFLVPQSSAEQVRAAHAVNTGCLTSLKGCRGFCELSGRTINYLQKHPDALGGFVLPECN